jgi:Tol biopolymer transport system component
MLLYFTGDYGSFEHVLTHEMTHAFQYDIFAHGKAGNGLQALVEYMPPLWFAEGMAEYLSLGPTSSQTTAWMRDAALNGHIPTIKQLTDQPDQYFPYRFGQSVWAYVARKWGDEVIGEIMSDVPSVGVERAFRRELGVSLEDLGREWKEDLQTRLLPPVATMQRPRGFAQALLTPEKSGGGIFLAPSLSPDGKRIAFLSNGNALRGQVFIDLWLASTDSGARIARLARSEQNPDFEELRVLYSQSAFSPDGRTIAMTAQRAGKDVLYLIDVATQHTLERFDLPLETVTGPTWSPDGRRLVFSGGHGGITDLYMVDVDGSHLRQLTDDRYGDMQPQWSPDGTQIAFASDRGDSASFALLRLPPWRITLLDLASGAIRVIPGQGGLNINPQWAPDGRSIAYVSDRTGTANLFLYDLDRHEHYQLTNTIGAVAALTEYSPAISWARQADRLAFTYYDDGAYTIWSVNNPRGLRDQPYKDASATVVAAATPPGAPRLVTTTALSLYREPSGRLRPAAELPTDVDSSSVASSISVVALLDSFNLALPDTTRFRVHPYHVRLRPDYVARPSFSYSPDAFGRNVFGGTTVVLSDMPGNNHLAIAGQVNGRIDESQFLLGYTNVGHRWQYSVGVSQAPYYFLSADSLSQTADPAVSLEAQQITTYVARQAFAVTEYPINRFTRVEIGGGFNNVDRERWFVTRTLEDNRAITDFHRDSIGRDPTLNYLDGQLALVSDNTLAGYTGPLMGRRFRFQVSPVFGTFKWIEYLADYRRYDPIIFNYLTLATRAYANIAVGPNETAFPKYIARPDFVRGYDRNSSFYLACPIVGANPSNCGAVQLLGSRVGVVNVELRFPLIRRLDLGFAPVTLPPLDGAFFYDEGLAWSGGQTLYLSKPDNYDVSKQRYPVGSYGLSLRLNLFNYAILRWDYAVPLDQSNRRGFWTWSLWPAF